MKKARIILGFWVAVFLYIHYFFLSEFICGGELTSMLIKQLILSVLSVSALSILISTCFKVDVDMSGNLCYDKNNPFWKFSRDLYGIGKEIKLCRIYWFISLTLAIAYLVLACLITFLILAIKFIKVLWEAISTWSITEDFILAIITILAIAIFVGLWSFGVSLYTQKKLFKKILGTIILAVIYIPIIFFLGFMIINGLIFLYEYLAAADLIAVAGLVLFFAMVTSYIMIRLLFKFFPSLKNTILGAIFFSAEKKLCPIVYGCDMTENI